jgi:DNA-binding MarR family transcriptional regulator
MAPPRDETRYAQSLAFLLSQVGSRSAQAFAERLAPLGISPRAYGVLSNVAASDGRTQQQLADALGIHRNNMVGLVDELESAGWVRRHRSDVDRRAFHVLLTEAGAKLTRQVDAVIPVLDDEVGQGLTSEERQTMVELLTRMASVAGLRTGVHPRLRGWGR